MTKTTITCDAPNCNMEAKRFSVPVGRVAEQGTGSMADETIDFDLCPERQRILIREMCKRDKCAFVIDLFELDGTPTI